MKMAKRYKVLLCILLFLVVFFLFSNITNIRTTSNGTIFLLGYVAILVVGMISVYKNSNINYIEKVIWYTVIFFFNLLGLVAYCISNGLKSRRKFVATIGCLCFLATTSVFSQTETISVKPEDFEGKNSAEPPAGLTTDLIEHTGRVFLDGYPANFSLEERHLAIERYQVVAIRSERPYFGWIMNDAKPNTLQTAYRILVASDANLLSQNQGDMWDSGRAESDNSTAIQYAGKPLQTNAIYYWKVQTWSNHGEESPFSEPKSFITAATLDNLTACYPLQFIDEYPVRIRELGENRTFIDFGKAAFGRLRITLFSPKVDTVVIHIGEHARDGRVDRNPGGTIRYAAYKLPVMAGRHT